MRIAVIAPPWLPVPPPAYGGSEAVVDRLARAYQARGHDVVLYASADSTCPVPLVPTVASGQIEHVGSPQVEWEHVNRAYDAVEDVDVVHDHTVFGPLCAGAEGRPVVVTNHGPFDGSSQGVFARIARSAAVVAISQAQADRAAHGTVHSVVHHGIDTNEFPIGPGTGGYLAFVGRMSPTKGVRPAIEIARRAGVPLLITAKCREPGEVAYFEDEIRPLLGGDVEYLGETSPNERNVLLGGAMALLNPFRWSEPFGLVMIESLATGTPVLALDRGAAPEIVTHGITGFIEADDDGLVRRIAEVADLDRSACRARIESAFSVDAMVDRYLEVFRSVLTCFPARPSAQSAPPPLALPAA